MLLGKRKREMMVVPRQRSDANGSSSEKSLSAAAVAEARAGGEDAHAIFRKYFESRFEPLPEPDLATPELQEDDDDEQSDMNGDEDEDDDWDGFSDDDDDEGHVNRVQVVEHNATAHEINGMTDAAAIQKAFMSSKPPKEDRAPVIVVQQNETAELNNNADELSDTLNLKNDLELQRLLKESHLLDPSSLSTPSSSNKSTTYTTPGSIRHQVTDLRMQALGAKTSIVKQERMPMAHRKGMAGKAAFREAARRKEARENGVVLEKVTGVAKGNGSRSNGKRRERGVDAPAVGKFRGGTLRLSRRDVSDIQGPVRAGKSKKRSGKRSSGLGKF